MARKNKGNLILHDFVIIAGNKSISDSDSDESRYALAGEKSFAKENEETYNSYMHSSSREELASEGESKCEENEGGRVTGSDVMWEENEDEVEAIFSSKSGHQVDPPVDRTLFPFPLLFM